MPVTSSSTPRRANWFEVIRPLVIIAASLAVLVLVAMWLVYYIWLVRVMYTALHMNDFGKFYYSTKAAIAGGNMYGPTVATAQPLLDGRHMDFLDMNPPHFHVLLLPFSWLEPGPALTAWWAANFAALAASATLVFRTLHIRWTFRTLGLTALAVLLCSATGAILVTGQLTFLLLLPLTLAWSNAAAGRWHSAAIYLGVVASIKPFLGLFLVFFILRRQWRTAAWFLGSMAGCFLLGLVFFGVQAHLEWLRALAVVHWQWAVMNGSLAGMLNRTLAESPSFTPMFQMPAIVTPLNAILSVAVLAVTFLLLGRRPASPHHLFAGLLLAGLLVSPLGWIYYLWFVAPALIGLWPSLVAHRTAARTTLLIAALPGLVTPYSLAAFWRDEWWNAVTLGSLYTWSTLALWALVMLDARTATVSAVPHSGGAKYPPLLSTSMPSRFE